MNSDLKRRIFATTEKWDGAPDELIHLKKLLSTMGKDVSWNPKELVNNMLKPNENRTHLLREIIRPLYAPDGFWTDESIQEILHKCLIACKELGIEVTQQILDGNGSIEEDLAFWDKILKPRRQSLTKHDSDKYPDGRKRSKSTDKPPDDLHKEFENRNHEDQSGRHNDPTKTDGNLPRTESSMTASFTELPDIHGDHVDIDEHGNYVKPKHIEKTPINQDIKKAHEIRHDDLSSPLSDFPTTDHEPKRGSVLARYDRSGSADESTQAGVTSWDWLSRLESLLIHFFLIIFDSSADSSKLMMELMPTEATKQIEDIFRLLLQAEPEMYQNLGHIVNLAEKWLVHWGGNSDQKAKALEFVRLYMLGVKNKKYYSLPVQVRLQQLGSFISGLKALEGEGGDFDTGNESIVPNVLPYKLIYVEPLSRPNKRPPSPRVKPAAHFARVVASLLCDRPCNRPLTPPEIYADDLAKNVFQNPLHGDRGFQTYVDEKYGEKYEKKDIFMRELPRQIALSFKPKHLSKLSSRRRIPHNENYGSRGRSTHGNRNGKGDNTDDIWTIATNGKRVRLRHRNPAHQTDYEEDEYEKSVIVGPGGKVTSLRKLNKPRRSKSGRQNVGGYNSDTEWEHDPTGRRIKRKPGKYPQVGDPDYDSDEEWVHGKNGKRTRRKHPLVDGRRPQSDDPEYNSEEEWIHDIKGKRLKRKQPLRGGQRPQPGDLDYNSNEEWEHDKSGKRQKRRNHPKSKMDRQPQPGDPVYNSDEEWVHGKNGKRTQRKHPLLDGRRPQPDDPEYNSEEEWIHDTKGKRLKRKQPLRGGQRPQPGDLDYDSNEEWEHDKSGKRQKRRNHPKSKLDRQPQPGDPDYNSDEEWVHGKNGKRTQRKHPLVDGRRPQPDDPEYSSEEEWIHDTKGKRLKRKQPLRGGQRPQPGDLDYNSNEEWEHDKSGKRVKRRNVLESKNPAKGVYSTIKQTEGIRRKSNKLATDFPANGDSKFRNPSNPKGKQNSETNERKPNAGQLEKKREDVKMDPNHPKTRYNDGTRRAPSWISTQDSNTKIKLKGVFRSQADLDQQFEKTRKNRKEADDEKQRKEADKALAKAKIPTMSVLAMRSTMLDNEKFVKKPPPISPVVVLKELKKGENFGEDGFDEAALLAMLDNNRKTVYTVTVDASQMEAQMSSINKKGCPASLWGVLPIPAGDMLQNGKIPNPEGNDRIPIQPNNVLREDTTGAFGDYASIPANVNRFKQIFRDEARALGRPRPSTAEITSKMIERTARIVRKKLEEEDLEDMLDPGKKIRDANRNQRYQSQNRPKRFVPKRRSIPLAAVLLDLLKRDPAEFGGEESDSGLIPENERKSHSNRQPPRELHPGVMDEIALRFHGVTSGPFIPHVDRSHKNRITFSLEDKPLNFYDQNQRPQKGSGDGRKSYFEEDEQSLNDEGVKLPSLAVREKTSSNPIIPSKGSRTKLPSIDHDDDEGYTYTDTLLYPNNLNQGLEPNNKMNSLRKSAPLRRSKNALYNRPTRGSKNVLTQYQSLGGQGDQELDGPMSPCWEMASKLFKTPLRTPAIPFPDNLIIHIEKKCPGLQWPRGVPVALRYYPSGQPFCIVFQNGAGRVHYPHGGLAVAISAPSPTYSRILIIRDPFDQFYFFDKAILADHNCNGTGTVYDENGIIKVQYNLQGGYRQEGLDKPSQRWHWNRGGQRVILKLNRYMALRILDLNKIYLVFYGNKRGFRLNVGAGQRVNLMSVTCDSGQPIPRNSERPKSACGGFDYIRGRFSTPVLGFLDKARKEKCITDAPPCSLPSLPTTFKYSFSQCHMTDAGAPKAPCQNHDCYVENCQDN